MRRILVALLLLVILFFVFSTPILTALGGLFIHSDSPHKTGAIIVPAGGSTGDRILKACELVRSGFANTAWVSGPHSVYGQSEANIAIDFAVQNGCDRSWFEPFPNHCNSTRDEAIFFGPILKQRRIQDYTVVTSSYHTHRAGRIFKEEIPDIPLTLIASQEYYYKADTWWKSREGRKLFFSEAIKSLTSPFGI